MSNHACLWQPGGVAIWPTERWEEGGIRNFTGSAIALGDGDFRLWYYARTLERHGCEIAVAEGKPGGIMRKHKLYRSSGDATKSGAEWTLSNIPDGWQPVQPVYLRLPSGGHRLYFWAHAPGVVRYLCAESHDGKHFVVNDPYKPILWHYHDRAVEAKNLPNGLTVWGNTEHKKAAREQEADPGRVCNDATNIYVLPDGTYELFTAAIDPISKESPRFIADDNAAGFVRSIDRFISQDGLTFCNRQRVLEPDHNDHPGLQFYSLAVTHLDGKRFGFIGHYRADMQTLAMERAWSTDGIVWERPDRKPSIGPAFSGDKDVYGASAGHSLIEDEGLWWCFYTGFRHTHNFKRSAPPPSAYVLFARCEELI